MLGKYPTKLESCFVFIKAQREHGKAYTQFYIISLYSSFFLYVHTIPYYKLAYQIHSNAFIFITIYTIAS
jgi:hypothetical protein